MGAPGLLKMPRRNTELLLLGAVTPIVLLVFALVRAVDRPALSAADFLVPGGLLLAFGAAHIAARRFAPGADPALLPIAALLSGVGPARAQTDAPAAGQATLGSGIHRSLDSSSGDGVCPTSCCPEITPRSRHGAAGNRCGARWNDGPTCWSGPSWTTRNARCCAN